MAGKSSSGGLLGRSIGIQPPRLLYGRAASYGSIINPARCHRPDGSSPSFAGGFIAHPKFPPGSWRTYLCGFGFWPAYRNVPDECVFSCQATGEERQSVSVFSGLICLSSCVVADEKGHFVAIRGNFFKKISDTKKAACFGTEANGVLVAIFSCFPD